MTRVFADTLYWVARIRPGDAWHEPARRAEAALREHHVFTTEEVLTESLNALAGGGPLLRRQAVALMQRLRARPDVTVLVQSDVSFLAGLSLYERRSDKRYSLTDCVSMNAMREYGITDVLTNDHHFEQEGFNVLIRK